MPMPMCEGQPGCLLLRLTAAEKSQEPLDSISCLAPCCRVGRQTSTLGLDWILRALLTPCSDLPMDCVTCDGRELGQVWGLRAGQVVPLYPSPWYGLLQALGIWLFVFRGSSPCFCSCCLFRCQNSVQLQGLNFWKPIQTCLLWAGLYIQNLWIYTAPHVGRSPTTS